jgi:hypothetical protein
MNYIGFKYSKIWERSQPKVMMIKILRTPFLGKNTDSPDINGHGCIGGIEKTGVGVEIQDEADMLLFRTDESHTAN